MNKTRVLHVIGGGEVGGAEELVLTLMKLLDRRKYEPCLLCLCEGPFAALAEQQGFKAITIAMKHRLDTSTIEPVRRCLRENRISLLHTHGVRANFIARQAAKMEGLPVVTTVHSVLRFDYDSSIKAALARFLTMRTNRKTDRFIAISAAIEQELLGMGVEQERITIIHNGLDTSKFSTVSRPREEIKAQLGLNPELPVVSIIARLHPVKGHQYFLRAAAEIIRTGLKAQFLIVGEGRHRAAIEKLVQQLNLGGKVFMPGYYDAVEEIYALTDVLCVPSLMEGLGLVVLEAMHFKVPVVASNTGGIPEMIKDRVNGLLVEPRDYQALAGAVMTLLVDTGLREYIIEKGLQTVNKFTLENMAHQVEQVYEQVRRSGGS